MSWELHRQSGKNRILIITSLINCHTLLTADNCQMRVKEYWLRGGAMETSPRSGAAGRRGATDNERMPSMKLIRERKNFRLINK
jgi:hypothetical protein